MASRRRILTAGLVTAELIAAGLIAAGLIAPLASSVAHADVPVATPIESVRYAVATLLRHLPTEFDGDKDWGNTKRVFNGVDVKFRDGKIRTHRRWKEVDHGRWVAYEIRLPPRGLRVGETVHVDRAVVVPPPGRGLQMDLRVATPIDFKVRIQRHVRGIRLASVTVTGQARVQLTVTAMVDSYSDITEIPPAIVVEPQVQSAVLTMPDFEVDHISRLGGDVAEAWGEIAQEVLVKDAIERQNRKLVDRLNRTIDRHREDLRFSPRDFMRRAMPSPDPSDDQTNVDRGPTSDPGQ